MSELDTVVLTRDLPQHGLMCGDVGAIALLSLTPKDIRPMRGNEVLHVRELASA